MGIYFLYISRKKNAFEKESSPPTSLIRELLRKLKNEDNLVLQKSDKVNTILIIGNNSYCKSVKEFLIEWNIPADPDRDLNYIINCEKMNQNLPTRFKNLYL